MIYWRELKVGISRRDPKPKYALISNNVFMKNSVKISCIVLLLFAMTSCYSHKMTIGEGPQTGVQLKEKNNFFLFGLVPGKLTEPQALVGDTTDYEITEEHTFVDGLLGFITFGIYTPTTTKIQK